MSTVISSSKPSLDASLGLAPSGNNMWMTLFKKELRQVFFLVGVLAFVGTLLSVMFLINSDHQLLINQGSGILPLLLMLSIYCIGVSPLVIGQEKESRTLYWLAALPVKPSQIVSSKFIAVLLGYIAITLLGYLLAISLDLSTAQRSLQWSPQFNTLWVGDIVAYSLFLLLLGFLMAWVCKNAWCAIAAQVIIFIIVFFVSLPFMPFERRHDSAFELLGWMKVMGGVMASLAVLAVLFWGTAKQSFLLNAPAASFAALPLDIVEQIQTRRSDLASVSFFRPVLSPDTAMVWQAYKQNLMVKVFLLMVALSLLYFYATSPTVRNTVYLTRTGDPVELLTSMSLAMIGALYMGCVAFASDSIQKRIHFLADRGAAPFQVWWTRLLSPVLAVIVAVAVLYVLNKLNLISFSSDSSVTIVDSNGNPVAASGKTSPALYAFGGLLLLSIGIGAWVAQAVRSPIIAFCLTPATAIVAYLYVVFIASAISFNILWLLPIAITPFIATATMTRRWMDGNYGLKTILMHTGFLAAATLIPLTPLPYAAATYPRLKLTNQSRDLSTKTVAGKLQALSLGKALLEDAATESDPLNNQKSVLKYLQGVSMDAPYIGVDVPPAMRGYIYSQAILAKRFWGENSDDPVAIERFAIGLENLFLISKLDRLTLKLMSQEYADRAEQWLVNELSTQEVRSLIPHEKFREWSNWLGDKDLRNRERDQAIMVSLKDLPTQMEIIGFAFKHDIHPTYGFFTTHVVSNRLANNLQVSLLNYLDSGKYREGKAFEQYKAYWEPNLAYQSDELSLSSSNYFRTPGLLWHGEWEDRAVKLRSQEP